MVSTKPQARSKSSDSKKAKMDKGIQPPLIQYRARKESSVSKDENLQGAVRELVKELSKRNFVMDRMTEDMEGHDFGMTENDIKKFSYGYLDGMNAAIEMILSGKLNISMIREQL